MLQRVARLLIVLLALFTLALIVVWVVTNTDYGRERVRRFALGALSKATHGIVKLGKVRGDLLTGATIDAISITDSAGRPFLKADSLSGRYTLGSLLRKRISISDLVIYRPDIVIEKLPGEKDWNYRRLWPASKPTPGDTIPGFGSWIKFDNARVIEGHLTVRSPWSPRAGVTARARDSLVNEALSGKSRLMVAQVPGGYVKVIELRQLTGRFPLLQLADPSTKIRLLDVAELRMQALPFRPPAAQLTDVVGRFRFNDDSLWWKGVRVDMPSSKMRGDGVYVIENGDMRLAATAQPAAFNDFTWLYPHMPKDGGGTASMLIQWRGATQDYVIRSGDARTGGAHLQGDFGITLTDTIVFHDANLRFTGLTTKLIKEIAPGIKPPREGVLVGRAKFDGTPKRLDLDADVTFASYNRGTSRVVADGVLGMSGTPIVVSARDLRVRMAPLQIDIAKLLFPTLPIGGTLTGTATLNGSGDRQLVMSNIDVVHQDGPNRSRAVGRVAVHTTGRQTMDVDLIARPVALAELRKFAPALPLMGYATGPFRASGPLEALRIDTRLALPGDATFALRGNVDFKSKELGYDVVVDATGLDLSRVMVNGPSTDLTGGGTARGRGFKPETMLAELDLAFGPSRFDTVAVDSIALQARLADGLATVARAEVRGSGAQVDVTGQFGLDASHSGALTYSVVIDSLATFAPFLPASFQPDTGVVEPRPRILAEAVQRASANITRDTRQNEVVRAMRGGAAPPMRVQVDTPRAIPRDLLAGSLRAAGTISGSIERFTLKGSANATGLIVRGNAARHVAATYEWADARASNSKMTATVRGDTISALGFAFDSLAADLSYLKPNGSVSVRVRQNGERDYALNGEFTLDNERNELRLAEMQLRFDTTSWRTTHASKVRWGRRGIEVVDLEMASGPGQRIYANGLLPTEGRADFDLQIRGFAVENVAELLQSDLPVTGRVSLDAHVEGTGTDPRMRGRLDFTRGTYNDVRVPDVHGTFAYANQQLTTNATAVDSTGLRLAVVDGTLPINLALSGVTGPRLLDAPMDVKIVSDSLPLALIPTLTDKVSEAGGLASANFTMHGTLEKPNLRGSLTLNRARFRLAPTGTVLNDLYGSVRMTGDTVYVDSIAGSANGPLRLSGTLNVGNWREPTFNLTFQAQDAELLNNDLGEIHANANLRITGPFAHANIAGRVSVVHGVIYIPETDGKKLVGAGDPQLFSVVDTSVALEREIFPAQSRLFEGLVVDVELTVERGTWVRSNEANVEIYTDGPMQVSVQGDALTLTGAVNADRGEYTFLSKRFQITRGSALFIGSPDINPTVQVTAEYQVKQATNVTNIRVLVGGTVRKPRISLESDAQPPLSQSDLLSYLAFGSSAGSLLQVGSTGAIAGGIRGTGVINAAGSRLAGVAVGVALDELEGDAARSLGLDVFNVTPGDIPIEQGQDAITQFLRGTEIEGGRYVSPSTYVSVVTTPGLVVCAGGDRANSSCALPGFTVQYRTNKGYRFETSLTPRYILDRPTLAGQTAAGTSQFGAFIIREWRF
ncbi:MAG TPA: translocation/assembly module TamB domain-containing protein [Gemmatimonadaceae bacterium]|nr:translocation/assembly module TamB domain-containing protein [Gemmatimonadaceae bacterium]